MVYMIHVGRDGETRPHPLCQLRLKSLDFHETNAR